MRTRTVLSTAIAVWSLGLLGAGSASAERSLLGVTVGRSYRTVLAKYGDPERIDPVYLPTGTAPQLGAQYGGVGGFGQPGGAPGLGGPGAADSGGGGFSGGAGGSPFGAPTPGGFPGGVPGGSGLGPGSPGGFPGGGGFSGGAPGGFPGGGSPPVLPGAGGFPGAAPGGEQGPGGFPGGAGSSGGFPGSGGFGGGQTTGSSVGNAALWTYRRPGGVTMEFLINEDGLVAQISISGRTFGASTGKGIHLGSGYSQLLGTYGFPDTHLILQVGQAGVQQAAMSSASIVKSGGQVTQVTYTKKHNVAFTLLNQKVVRMTVALAE